MGGFEQRTVKSTQRTYYIPVNVLFPGSFQLMPPRCSLLTDVQEVRYPSC
jgi:hypothetical protein